MNQLILDSSAHGSVVHSGHFDSGTHFQISQISRLDAGASKSAPLAQVSQVPTRFSLSV
jgi:hypothetical protein